MHYYCAHETGLVTSVMLNNILMTKKTSNLSSKLVSSMNKNTPAGGPTAGGILAGGMPTGGILVGPKGILPGGGFPTDGICNSIIAFN